MDEETAEETEVDCRFLISIFYNKQENDGQRPVPLNNNSFLSFDYLHSKIEPPEQLQKVDLCLRHSDAAWHLPLLAFASSHANRNKRQRSEDSELNRAQQRRENQKGKGYGQTGKGKRNQYEHRYTGKGKGNHRQYDRYNGPYFNREHHHWEDRTPQLEGWYGYGEH